MKTITLLLFCSVIASFAADPTETSVPLKFIPGKPSDGKGASFSALHPFPGKDGKTLMLQAHAGIGDSFPVQEEDKKTLFEIIMLDGDDEHVSVEVRSKGGSQKVNLLRDKPVEVDVAGTKYRFLFPRVTVSSAAKSTTTNQAMLIVDRRR